MAENIFDKFDKQVDLDAIQKQKEEASKNASNFEEVPSGVYITKMENMEIGTTKDGRPMFKVQMRIVEGCGTKEETFLKKFKNKKPCVFMNKVIFGTKNDGSMISSVEGFLAKMEFEQPIVFGSYSGFASDIMDAMEEIAECGLEFKIEYDSTKFNSISILEVFEP